MSVNNNIMYIIGRWNADAMRVEYLNKHRYWVRNITMNSLVFNDHHKPLSIGIPKNERARNHIFICKVFCKKNDRRAKYTLTNHNHWHKMEAMMNI